MVNRYFRYRELRAVPRNPRRIKVRVKSCGLPRKVQKSIRPYEIKMRTGGTFNQIKWKWNHERNPVRSKWFHHYMNILYIRTTEALT